MTRDVVVVGSLAYDDVETRFGKREKLLGGSATYFSVAASLFSTPRVVGVVGEDFEPSDRAMLDARGVDLDGLMVSEGATFRWGGRYHDDMNQRDTLFTHLNVFESFRPQLPEHYRSAEYVFLGNIAPGLQLEVLEQVTGPRFVALDTMNFWIDGDRDGLLSVLQRVDGIIINDSEGQLLTGRQPILAVAAAIRAMGPRTIVLKRGEHGAFLFNDGDTFYVPAFPLEEVVDPTGAGDTFAGGFMGYLCRTGDFSPDNLRRAMVAGSVTASFCVEGFGLSHLERVTLPDVQSRYRQFVSLTRTPGLSL